MIQAFGLTSNPRKDLPPAVDDVSFEARAGRVTTLLGAAGAGKTTALKLMLELQQGRGITYFRGRPLHRIAHPSREVGVLLGDVPGHPARTVRGHLRMLCAAAGVPVRRADEVLEVVGLVSLRDEHLGTLSRGMDRRLGLACALLADPHTLVVDGPAQGLTVRESRWLYGMLRAHATQGGTVLFTTTDSKEAARTADRIVTLEQGRVVADQEAVDFARTRLRPRVAVRSPHAARLAALLAKEARTAQRSVEVVQDGGNRLSVYGSTCADVGETAFRHGILVHQLADETGDMGPGAGAGASDERFDEGELWAGGRREEKPTVNTDSVTAAENPRTPSASRSTDAPHPPAGELSSAEAQQRPAGPPLRSTVTPPGPRAAAPADEQTPSAVAPPGTPAAPTSADVQATAPAPPVPAEVSPTPAAGPHLPEASPALTETPAADEAGTSGRPVVRPPRTPGTHATARSLPPAEAGTSWRPVARPPRTPGTHATARSLPPAEAGTSWRPVARPPRTPGTHTTARSLPPAEAGTLGALSDLPPPISVRPAPSPLRPLRYELRRAAGIGTGFLTAAAVLVTSAVGAVLLARVGHTPQPRLLAAWPRELPLPPAALGAGLLGALAFGDEFRHPALAADRGTVPRRLGLLAAKLLVSAATALMLAFLTVGCDAEVLYVVYGRELAQVPAGWFSLSASWIGLVVGCAWAGVLAAGVFRSTTAGLAAVVAVPVAVVPLVQKVLEGPSVRRAAGLSVRLREVYLLQWPFGGERYLAGAARVIAQPVGGALTLSLTALLCAYLLTTLRSRAR
ncbi:ATP-binding cassette domain-containing protein [Streptomyces sp. NPDC002928]|uniref:ABC transporter ATP-binding protein n=1 Tax=Streptomyces sp. NPDC002928 TaxID=3154440 RepID=UPI00339F190B